MHSLIYRTDKLRASGTILPEHTFYVDNIFSYKPLPYMKKLYYLDIDLYRYFIGREDQSVSEGNIVKRYEQQIRIVKDVLHTRRCNKDIESLVKGVMIESYLEPGNQKIGCGTHVYGKSITDPCLGWDQTERLIYDIAEEC